MAQAHTDTVPLPTVRARETAEQLTLTLQRPQRGNSLNRAMLEELGQLLDQHCQVSRPLVLRAKGRNFCLGSDLGQLASLDGPGAYAFSLLAQGVAQKLEAWPGMTIAVIHGHCMGAGLELALACDQIVAFPNSDFGLPGLAWALLPVMGGLRRLSRRCPPHLAQELFLTNRILNAHSAQAEHLLQTLLRDETDLDRLLQEAREWGLSAVLAIRDLRLHRYALPQAEREAQTFAYSFYSGEAPRRIRALLEEG